MLQVVPPLQLLELKRLTALESSDSCSSYSFPSLSLMEFYPILGNFVFIQNSRRLSVDFQRSMSTSSSFLCLECSSFLASSDSDSSRPLCSAWDPFPPLGSGKCLQAEIQGDHRGYLICFAFLKVHGLCAYCCLKQYKKQCFSCILSSFLDMLGEYAWSQLLCHEQKQKSHQKNYFTTKIHENQNLTGVALNI